jgi:spore coat polysaccharide biosynthesis protein SpsF (cytidylyltransferase family)
VQGTGEKVKIVMKKKITYEKAPDGIDEAIFTSKRLEDILPSPDKLVKKEETVKVTISLSQKSVKFFKKRAEKQGVPYQNMIKSLIDKYADYYSHPE